MSILCNRNSHLRNELTSFREEIRHLTKTEKISFAEARDKAENEDKSRECCSGTTRNSILCKISDECDITLNFKVGMHTLFHPKRRIFNYLFIKKINDCWLKEPIEIALVLDKFEKDVQKIEKKIASIKAMIAKPRYDMTTDEDSKEKHLQEVNF